MNKQNSITDILKEVSTKNNIDVSDINWYSWPQVFGSTAGPNGGIGGQMITTFQVYAFELPNGDRIRYCAGKWRKWNGEFQQRW